MAEHKHAEVLRAIADGKEVQYNPEGKWIDVTDLENDKDPITNADYEWRVKPEPKPDVVITGWITSDFYPAAFNFNSLTKVKLTIDGETNEPKAVELVK